MQLNHNFKFPQTPQNKLSALSQLPAGARDSVIQSLFLATSTASADTRPDLGAAQGNQQGLLQYGQQQVPQQK